VKVQEDFKNQGGTTLENDNACICACAVVIHLVGENDGFDGAAGQKHMNLAAPANNRAKHILSSLMRASVAARCTLNRHVEAVADLVGDESIWQALLRAVSGRRPAS
jgi:hypothetical protein